MSKKGKLRLDDDMDYFDSQYLDYQDKKRKQAEMERKAERRDNIKFWMEVVTFVIMIFTIIHIQRLSQDEYGDGSYHYGLNDGYDQYKIDAPVMSELSFVDDVYSLIGYINEH